MSRCSSDVHKTINRHLANLANIRRDSPLTYSPKRTSVVTKIHLSFWRHRMPQRNELLGPPKSGPRNNIDLRNQYFSLKKKWEAASLILGNNSMGERRTSCFFLPKFLLEVPSKIWSQRTLAVLICLLNLESPVKWKHSEFSISDVLFYESSIDSLCSSALNSINLA